MPPQYRELSCRIKMCKKYIVIVIFLLVIIFVTTSGRSTVLNIENELDETMLHGVSDKEKREVENNLLNILELSNRPSAIARKAILVKRSGPKFLQNIYKNVWFNQEDKSIDDKYEDTEEFDTSGYDIDVIDQSNYIVTFGGHNPHSGNATKTNRGKRIWFNTSEVPQGQHIISAEVRLYQSLGNVLEYNKTYTITLHRVAKIDGRRIKYYINSVNTTTDKEGWITVNINEVLEYWVNNPRENRGLFVAVNGVDNAGHILRPDDIGIVGISGVPEKQPFMVGFFRNSEKRSKHDTSQRKKRDNPRDSNINSINIPNKHSRRENSCRMRALHVKFKDLNFDDWIIYPEGYNASYCRGECNYPLTDHMNATQHAIVQTLMHFQSPDEVPTACCVGIKLSPLSVIYMLDDSNFVLKKLDDMVINSCGCH